MSIFGVRVGRDCPDGPHTTPAGPCEDIGQCGMCLAPVGVMRPEGETFGFHADDCSLPERHRGNCQPGGSGHAPGPVIRGYWGPSTDDDIRREREKWGQTP